MCSKIPGIILPDSVLEMEQKKPEYVIVSDIDKTYLVTQIDSLKGLLKAAFESPERKMNVPGFSVLLRALRRGASETEQKKTPLYFLSASPPQLGPKLRAKMNFDGVEHDGIILKNQLKHVKRAEFKKLKEQVGYKLGALLSLWTFLPPKTRLLFFGDDSESDAVIFTLFSEIVAKNLKPIEVYQALRAAGVFRKEALQVAWLSREIKEASYPVQAAFINLETGMRPASLSRLSPLLFPTSSSLQMAFVLVELGLIRPLALKSIARDIIYHHSKSPEDLLKALRGALRHGYFQEETLLKHWKTLAEESLLPPFPDNFTGFKFKKPEGFVPRQKGAIIRKKSLEEVKELFSMDMRF